jgi:hypothetical protein
MRLSAFVGLSLGTGDRRGFAWQCGRGLRTLAVVRESCRQRHGETFPNGTGYTLKG